MFILLHIDPDFNKLQCALDVDARYYINGGCWLWAADTFFYRSAVWAGVADAEVARQDRLSLEVFHAFASHESMTAQGAATALEGYGSNALMLLT